MPEYARAFVQWLHEWQDLVGGFLGGLVGATGAIYAVYLTLSKQRKHDTNNVMSAVVTEVTAFSKYVIGAVEICIKVANGKRHVPQTGAAYIVQKLFAPPTVYRATADRIGLLPHPDATVQFYMRLEEVKAATNAIETAVKFQWEPRLGPPPLITRDIIAPIADSLITALQLAGPIIADAAKSGPLLERRIREVTVHQIDECLAAAKEVFPNAESFTDVPGTRPIGMSI
jgi:hypothetical protein